MRFWKRGKAGDEEKSIYLEFWFSFLDPIGFANYSLDSPAYPPKENYAGFGLIGVLTEKAMRFFNYCH